jgi:hypothetical protein
MITCNTTKYGEVDLMFSHTRNEDTIKTKFRTDGTKIKKAKKDTFTECKVIFLNSLEYTAFVGYSFLNPHDQFNKAIGRSKSMFNALEAIPGLDNTTRAEIEKAYANRNERFVAI